MRPRAALGGLAGLLLVLPVAGCAGDTESYCAELEEQEQTLTDLASRADQPGTDVFTESLDVFEALRDAAPGDVVDEWDTLVFAWQGLADAFEAAGTTPTEFDPADPPRPGPGGGRPARRRGRRAALPRVVSAGDGIEQHAKDVCGSTSACDLRGHRRVFPGRVAGPSVP